jgi:hypothetical protein
MRETSYHTDTKFQNHEMRVINAVNHKCYFLAITKHCIIIGIDFIFREFFGEEVPFIQYDFLFGVKRSGDLGTRSKILVSTYIYLLTYLRS